MLSIETLNIIRAYELDYIENYFFSDAKILEIGGGTGIQAKILNDKGYEVTSVDVSNSNYANEKIFTIIEYDGKKLPFADNTFDIIFSSNTLEHIVDLESLYTELERVLKPDGYSIHLMPSGTWRFWNIVGNYLEMVQITFVLLKKLLPEEISINELKRIILVGFDIIKCIGNHLIPSRHGETGNFIFEIWTFSRYWWISHFNKNNYKLLSVQPMGLFYSGHMILGQFLTIKKRILLARWLGSSCILYKVKSVNN